MWLSRKRIRTMVVAFCLVAVAVAPARALTAGSAAAPVDAASYIANEFPDRKTSSYDGQRLTSYLSGQLQSAGWQAEVRPYSTLVRTGAEGAPGVKFMQVSGENVIGFARHPAGPGQTAGRDIDLLLVAPYDTLFEEGQGTGSLPSYTARATAILLDFCLTNAPEELPGNIAVAFVSGHYQYGAGIRSALADLQSAGVTIRAAAVVGDVSPLRSLPVCVMDSTPVSLAGAACMSAKENGLAVTLAGPRARETWYRASTSPIYVQTAEFILDGGTFRGEAEILASAGVPALTLGVPRGETTATSEDAYLSKSGAVASSLKSLARAMTTAGASQERGPSIADTVVLQGFGEVRFVARSVVLGACAGVAALAVIAIVLALRGQKDLGPLAITVGVLAAFVAAHGLRTAGYSIGGAKSGLLYYPERLMPFYFFAAGALVLLGFLRLWRIRTRIAHLHARMPAAATPQDATRVDGDAAPPGVPVPAPAHNWAGPWGLAFSAAVLLGTAILGCEMAPMAAVATLSLTLAALTGRGLAWVKRLLCTIPLLPLIFWAGAPVGDAARIYALTLTRMSVETASFTILSGVLVACLLSTFTFPAPARPSRVRLITVAELGTVALLVAVVVVYPSFETARLPAVAVVQEYLGNEARMTIDTPRALGPVEVGPEAGAHGTQMPGGVPAAITNRVLSDMIRLSISPAPSPWVNLRVDVAGTVKGDTTTKVAAALAGTVSQAPSVFEVNLRCVGSSRDLNPQFTFEGLDETLSQTLGGEVTGPLPGVSSWTGNSITVSWWMPKDTEVSVPFTISYGQVSSRVEALFRATYVGKSGLGVGLSASGAGFLTVTNVTKAETYR